MRGAKRGSCSEGAAAVVKEQGEKGWEQEMGEGLNMVERPGKLTNL